MKVIIHGGLGKTATTWLQTVALPISGVTLLGKKGGEFFGFEAHSTDRLRHIQYEVFPQFLAR